MRDKEGNIAAAVAEQAAVEAITRAPFALVLTNPLLPDNPIVYVNRAFETMTGYTGEAVIGRNCRFLQGDDTDQPGLEKLRRAIANREEVIVTLRNYRADGSRFLNRLMVAPLQGAEDEVPYFLGVQTVVGADTDDISDIAALAELQHRVKNHLSMIVGMVRLQSRQSDTTAGQHFDTLARRVETLQLLYEELCSNASYPPGNNTDTVNLGAYLTRICNAIAYIDGRGGVRVNIDSDDVSVSMQTATQLGLALSEILTNAMQHAFRGREAGLVEIGIKLLGNDTLRVKVVDDGVGMPPDVNWPKSGSLGGRIVKQLVRGLSAKLTVESQGSGTTVVIDVPLT